MKPKLNINESFICKIWENPGYYSNLQTTDGKDVEVIDSGRRNYDSGPDYLDAKIKIDSKTLTGDIEIHRDFKNWAEHNHPKDRRYNSVILHVALWDSQNRQPPKLRIKRELPTVILSHFLNQSIHDIWQEIISAPSDKLILPCYNLNDEITEDTVIKWIGKLSIERLTLKSNRIISRLLELHRQTGQAVKKKILWEQVLYEFIFEALGFSKNKEQMLKLASSLTLFHLKKILKNDHSPVFLQALLFGSSGLLFDVRLKDNYTDEVKKIWKEYEYKIQASGLKRPDWNFFRQRPQNFPTIRIAYGSQIVQSLLNGTLLKKLVEVFKQKNFHVKERYSVLAGLFAPETDVYWENHYDFAKKSKKNSKLLGKQRLDDIIMNVLIP